MGFTAKEFTFTLSGSTLLIILAIVVVFIGGLITYNYLLTRKLRQVQAPKFGFLGKPIYPLVAVLMLAGSLFFFNYAAPDQEVINIKASRDVSVEIVTQVTNKVGTLSNVNFQAIPTVDNQIWGETGETFDFIWNITGETEYSKVELNKNATDVSGFTTLLEPGDYQVDLTLVFEGKSYEFTDSFSLQ